MKKKLIVFMAIIFSAVVFAFVKDHPAISIINGERPIVVVIPSYNNSQWYTLNLGKLFSQNYTNYRAIYIDDCSDDGTADLVEKFIAKYGQQKRVQLIKNKERKGALYNLYHAIYSCNDREIIITYDGDDWFKDDQVLQTINDAYRDHNVWLTYGQFEVYPGNKLGQCQPMPDYFVKSHSYRKQAWITSHLRTFYAGLFKKIKQEDLIYNGNFFEVTWDQAFMFPMLEMANGNIKFIDKVLYVYNQSNPLNDFKVRLGQQLYCERLIRRKPVYEPLEVNEAKRSFVLT